MKTKYLIILFTFLFLTPLFSTDLSSDIKLKKNIELSIGYGFSPIYFQAGQFQVKADIWDIASISGNEYIKGPYQGIKYLYYPIILNYKIGIANFNFAFNYYNRKNKSNGFIFSTGYAFGFIFDRYTPESNYITHTIISKLLYKRKVGTKSKTYRFLFEIGIIHEFQIISDYLNITLKRYPLIIDDSTNTFTQFIAEEKYPNLINSFGLLLNFGFENYHANTSFEYLGLFGIDVGFEGYNYYSFDPINGLYFSFIFGVDLRWNYNIHIFTIK